MNQKNDTRPIDSSSANDVRPRLGPRSSRAASGESERADFLLDRIDEVRDQRCVAADRESKYGRVIVGELTLDHRPERARPARPRSASSVGAMGHPVADPPRDASPGREHRIRVHRGQQDHPQAAISSAHGIVEARPVRAPAARAHVGGRPGRRGARVERAERARSGSMVRSYWRRVGRSIARRAPSSIGRRSAGSGMARRTPAWKDSYDTRTQ